MEQQTHMFTDLGLICLCPSQELWSCQSIHITTLSFLGKLDEAVNQYFVHILSLVTDNNASMVPGQDRSRGREFDPGPVPYFRGD